VLPLVGRLEYPSVRRVPTVTTLDVSAVGPAAFRPIAYDPPHSIVEDDVFRSTYVRPALTNNHNIVL